MATKKYIVNHLYSNCSDLEERGEFRDEASAREFYDDLNGIIREMYALEHRQNRFFKDTWGTELVVVYMDEDGYEDSIETLEYDTYSYADYLADTAEAEEE